MASEVDAKVANWRSWIEGPIWTEVRDMYVKRHIFREVNQMLHDSPVVGEMPSAFWDFYHQNYAAAQASAVRRQADTDRDTAALAPLIKEIRETSELLTRERFVALWDQTNARELRLANECFDRLAGLDAERLDRSVPDDDLQVLQRAARKVRGFVDQHIAHDQADPTAEGVTYEELHAAIDAVGKLFKKYAVILTAGTYSLEPHIQDGWKDIFRLPWLAAE